jgi:hypothetical protein
MAVRLTTDSVIGLTEVLARPHAVAEHLVESGVVYGLTEVDVRVADPHMVVFWLTLEPWAPMSEQDYPTERVSITVWAGGRVTAVPIGAAGRTWKHRYPYVPGRLDRMGELCLWFPGDPRSLRWEWADGFVSYVTIVHRHLQAEEYARRHNGLWPAEDAPHGNASSYPIRTSGLRAVAEGRAGGSR